MKPEWWATVRSWDPYKKLYIFIPREMGIKQEANISRYAFFRKINLAVILF